jgi:hypothetical protein
MPCEQYKDALIEAAACGGNPPAKLRAHLAACAVCRAAFAQEQSLFATIDAGLHAAANPEVPASLLPRVRASIDEAAIDRRGWVTHWLALASAVVFAFLAVQTVRRLNLAQKPAETATQASPPAPMRSVPRKENSFAAPSTKKNYVSQLQAAIAKNRLPQETLASRNPEPEVLVPRDQEVLLAHYVEERRGRKRELLVAQDSGETTLALLEVAPIQIAQLDVKPLAEEQSQ